MTLIAFATCLEKPHIQPSDALLAVALERRGARVVAAPWNGAFEPFVQADATIIRSTWDYQHNVAAFENWLQRLHSVRGKVFNAPSLMRWNMAKTYLVDLAARGAPLPPTRVADRDAGAIARAMDELGLAEAVVKPIYGATSSGLSLVRRGDGEGRRTAVRKLDCRALVQALVPEIAAGETSLLFFAGEYSHAVVKRPIAGDIRSQAEFGGTVATVAPPSWAIEEASRILALLPEPALYARVDVVLLDGTLWLMEVEVIEPDLFLTHDDGAAARLADALINETDP
jgi:glutathione synthase/RimK-type ligase-like ATP-grasp enzyme